MEKVLLSAKQAAIRKIKSLLTDYGYTVKFITCKDDDSYELVTELVITWYNK